MLSARLEHDAAPRDQGATPDAERRRDGAERARLLLAEGRLTVQEIDDAIFSADRPFVIAAVAGLAGVDEQVVDRAFKAQSAKGTVALAWTAGLGTGLARTLPPPVA